MHAAGAEGMGSMKSQFKKADASGARYALVFGAQELAAGHGGGQAAARDRDAGLDNRRCPLADAVSAWAHAAAHDRRLQSPAPTIDRFSNPIMATHYTSKSRNSSTSSSTSGRSTATSSPGH
jgi:hypothetical protein